LQHDLTRQPSPSTGKAHSPGFRVSQDLGEAAMLRIGRRGMTQIISYCNYPRKPDLLHFA